MTDDVKRMFKAIGWTVAFVVIVTIFVIGVNLLVMVLPFTLWVGLAVTLIWFCHYIYSEML